MINESGDPPGSQDTGQVPAGRDSEPDASQPEAEDSRLVYGLQPVREALRVHGSAVLRLALDIKDNKRLDGVARLAESAGVQVDRRSRAVLDRVTRGGRHQGAVAEVPRLDVLTEISQLPLGPHSLFMVLDKITDPQNFGAVIRSTVALGDGIIIWGEHGTAPLTPATFRASAGAIEHATLCCVRSLRAAVGDLSSHAIQTVALDAHAENELSDLDLCKPTALVIGAEDQGVSRGVRQACDHTAKLPMRGRLDSLNASVAAAVALYEVQRQRTRATMP